MKRKLVLLILCAVMILGAASACVAEKPAESEPDDRLTWHDVIKAPSFPA
jgi:outer membrane lipoprotein-sorting protein